MDEAVAVGVGQGTSHAQGHRGGRDRLQSPALFQDRLEVAPVHQLHDDEVAPVILPHVEDLHHVGVRKACRRLGLPAEALHKLSVAGELVSQELHRDGPPQKLVDPSVDDGHAALAHARHQAVAPGKPVPGGDHPVCTLSHRCVCRALSCPQAASISAPRDHRTVTVTPSVSSISAKRRTSSSPGGAKLSVPTGL